MSRASRQERAFTVYLELGPSRSLEQLRRVLAGDPAAHGFRRAPSASTIEGWSRDFGWQARLRQIEQEAREQEAAAHVERVRGYQRRLREEGLLLQQKGIAWLREKDTDDVRALDAIRAISEGFRLEALSLGEATDRLVIAEEHETRLEGLSDDELERLVGLCRAAAADRAAGALAAAPD